jgi:hypothetical protein
VKIGLLLDVNIERSMEITTQQLKENDGQVDEALEKIDGQAEKLLEEILRTLDKNHQKQLLSVALLGQRVAGRQEGKSVAFKAMEEALSHK